MTDKPTPTDTAAPECLTCSDHGAVGNILTAEPCPDCTRLNAQPAPATQPAPVLWVSPEQFANFMDSDEAPFGKYVPARKTSAGNFTMPLFAARAPAGAGETPWRSAVLDLIDECPGLTMEQDRWLSRRVKELGFASAPRPMAHAEDSVQEDSARLDFLIEQRAYVVSDPDTCTGHWLHWARPDGDTWVQVDKYPTPRAAIDAARKQEEKQ